MDSCTDRCAGSARPVDGPATTVESSDGRSEPYRECRRQSFLSRRQRRPDTSDGSGPACRNVFGGSVAATWGHEWFGSRKSSLRQQRRILQSDGNGARSVRPETSMRPVHAGLIGLSVSQHREHSQAASSAPCARCAALRWRAPGGRVRTASFGRCRTAGSPGPCARLFRVARQRPASAPRWPVGPGDRSAGSQRTKRWP